MPAARSITRNAAPARVRKSRTGCTGGSRRRVTVRPLTRSDGAPHTGCPAELPSATRTHLFTTPSRCPTIAPPVGDLHSVSAAFIPQTHPLFSVEDMRPLYHFISSASLTIVDMQGAKQHWQTTVVEIALHHGFLLHSILAFSALHLAHLHPEERSLHANRAANHLERALSGVHPQMASISV
ncbi:hypothetical protein GTA08_BOTSDO12049 [Neofusicoccum parvum]|uniref:Uncharacterized protein n=1 Tax=Neofusicoccum parvum TaxID=310453 RepID=A0ACB5RTX1_9PEZI|nr:hypothetical protein GTA08_BOTSDO12049 [Neofusicoccum parvum]